MFFFNIKFPDVPHQAIEECHGKFFADVTAEDLVLYVCRFQRKSDRLYDTTKQAAERRLRRINEYSGCAWCCLQSFA